MGQRKVCLSPALFVAGLFLLILGCDKPSTAPSTAPTRVTVASLVPAATDLIDGMGAADRLVAISSWDPDRPQYKGIPRAGDYRSIDWEKLSQVRPTVMITQFRADKKPPGLEERAAELKIRIVNVKNNTLAELYTTIDQLGDALDLKPEAAKLKQQLQQQVTSIQKSVSGKRLVKALMVRTPAGLDVVGGGNYLDELLTLAGGENVIVGGTNSYPTIDRELLVKLDPEVILQLLPGASRQVVQQASDFWKSLPQLQAVKSNRVFILTEDFLLLPGSNVARVATIFAEKLHPEVKP